MMEKVIDNLVPLALVAASIAALVLVPSSGAWGWFLLGAVFTA